LSVPDGTRKRSGRALHNDKAIRDAGIEEVLRVGVDHVSLRGVSALAGLTHGATYARYEDADEMLVDLWKSVLYERAVKLFTLCLEAAEHPSADSVRNLIGYVRTADKADVASIQLLLTARRIPVLLEEVEPFINGYLQSDNYRSPELHNLFARTISLYGLVTAQIVHGYHIEQESDYLELLEQWLVETLMTDPESIPATPDPGPQAPFIFEATGDDIRESLTYATYVVVGRSGYSHATVSRIARRSNVSPGTIYSLYESKEELVADSFRLALRSRWSRLAYFRETLEQNYLSQLLSQSTHSSNFLWRFYFTEFRLATVYNPALLAALEELRNEVHVVLPLLTSATDEEKELLAQVILIVNLLTTGVSSIATITGSTERSDFAQFTEPLRLAILKSVGTTWDDLFKVIDSITEPSTRVGVSYPPDGNAR
jgi:AcrR family transcriptional regulator